MPGTTSSGSCGPGRASARGIAAAAWILAGAARAAAGDPPPVPDLRRVSLELPGAPAAVVSTDLDGDGRRDLAVAVVYTVWDQLELEERTRMDDVEGLVEVLTIVPALLDHRELFLFLADGSGGYRHLGKPLALAPSVLSVEAGPGGRGLLALTDQGVARLRWPDPAGEREEVSDRADPFELLIAEAPVLAGTGAFFPPLGLLRRLDDNGNDVLLLPAPSGFSLHFYRDGQLSVEPAQRGIFPEFDDLPIGDGDTQVRLYPLPEVRDTDGDGRAELLFPHPEKGWSDFRRARNLGDRFGALTSPLEGFPPLEDPSPEGPAPADPGKEEAVLFDDLDGDGRAELVTQEHLEGHGEGLREGLAEARRPEFRYRMYAQAAAGGLGEAPVMELLATGYALAGDGDFPFPGGFQDLDGDGRKDLVTLTLDFSLMQAVRVVATQRISIGLDFNVFCQRSDGSGFVPVSGLDLSGKFKFNLHNLRINQLSQFAGDFNGDGRADFLQIGRGKRASIHLGRQGCFYPSKPDRLLHLSEEPEDLTLVTVRDLDGDGLSDVQILQPLPPRDAESSRPVRLDLYLSGGDR